MQICKLCKKEAPHGQWFCDHCSYAVLSELLEDSEIRMQVEEILLEM